MDNNYAALKITYEILHKLRYTLFSINAYITYLYPAPKIQGENSKILY